jgi:hypothetical protein
MRQTALQTELQPSADGDFGPSGLVEKACKCMREVTQTKTMRRARITSTSKKMQQRGEHAYKRANTPRSEGNVPESLLSRTAW